MEKMYLESTFTTPKVVLDKEAGAFEFSGQSIPENALDFYGPIVNWLDKYAESPNEKTVVNFKFDYYNTASSKMIFHLLQKFDQIYHAGHEVEINWYYLDDDDEMLEAGEDYSSILEAKFNFKPYN